MKTEITERVRSYVDLANEIYGLDIDYPHIRFDLKGRVAGQANSTGYLRFNLHIAEQNWEQFKERTIVHEVAHLVVYKKYGVRAVPPHGYEWRAIMRDLGARDVTRGHRYDMTNVPVRKQLRFNAYCGCENPHKITMTRRNKMIRGYGYRCRTCGESLRLS